MVTAKEFSVVDELLEGNAIKLTGKGIMRLQPDQPGLPSGPPPGPGQVDFALSYAPEKIDPGASHTHAIKLGLSGNEEKARRILGGRQEEKMVPLARYDLGGTVEVGGTSQPIALDTIYVDHNSAASWTIFRSRPCSEFYLW